jgi:hypothetical protein
VSRETDELEALRRENELLRLRVREIGAKVPGEAPLTDEPVASMCTSLCCPEWHRSMACVAELASLRVVENEVIKGEPAREVRRSDNGGAATRIEPPASSQGNGSGDRKPRLKNEPKPAAEDMKDSVASEEEPDRRSTAPPGPAVQTAERQGLYEAPFNEFPQDLPTTTPDAVGPSPSFLELAGVQRRVPNSWRDLRTEMESLELKSPSDSLQVRKASCAAMLNKQQPAWDGVLEYDVGVGGVLHQVSRQCQPAHTMPLEPTSKIRHE